MRANQTSSGKAPMAATFPRQPTKPSSSARGTGRPTSQIVAATTTTTTTAGASTRPATRPPAKAPVRPSLIDKRQREALKISAFGFSTQPKITKGEDDSIFAGMTAKEKAVAKAMHTSGSAEAIVAHAEKNSTRFHLCVQALAEGCVQTYMRLFELSHRDPVCVDALSQTYFTIPDVKLRWVQEQLSLVEVLRRQSEFHAVFKRCRDLADYFESERDMVEATRHYESALGYALESLDRKLEQTVRGAFANFYERTGKYMEAARMYESMQRLAAAVGNEEAAQRACVNLARAYQKLGDEVRFRDPHLAKHYYELSAKAAQRSKCSVEEGKAYSALGNVNEQTGNLSKALVYQQSYLQVARREGQQEAECAAVLSVAGLQERLGMSIQAAKTLEEALELANQLGDATKICQAMMQLGEVSRAQEDEEAAMGCFRRAFEAACASGHQDLIDSARIAMGFATGEFYFTHAGNDRGYLPIICNDIRAQLAWMSAGTL